MLKTGMKIHYLQHVPYEDLDNIEPWAQSLGYSISSTRLFSEAEPLPKIKDFDWLIVLGGPMNVDEEIKYPWLKAEKKLIEKAIEKKKKVLGICLGAQMIAEVLGGKVTKNKFKEIGWHPVTLLPPAKKSVMFQKFPEKFNAFHWHGDTFSIPPGALHIAKSEGCAGQAFEFEGNVAAIQFHLESSIYNIKRLIKHCAGDLGPGKYVDTPADMLKPQNIVEIRSLLCELLDRMLPSLVNVTPRKADGFTHEARKKRES